MLSPPSIRFAPYYPVTSSIAVAAIALTLLEWSNVPLNEFYLDNQVWEHWQLWRALTSTLLHAPLPRGGIFHLAFNLYWFWTFGALIERVFGHLRCAAIFVLLALGSMLAQYAVLVGGIGLSGVVYGYWGMLWVLEQRDDRFRDAVDQPTSQMFIGWFFLCILLTVTGIMPVANVAHGVGAVMGVLLGFAICGRRQVQRESIAGLAIVLGFAVLCSTVYWPLANFSPFAGEEIEDAGIAALDQKDYARALTLLERAAHGRHATARMWYNLAVAYRDDRRPRDAVAAFERAAAMPDADDQMRALAKSLQSPPYPAVTNQSQ